MARAHGRLGEAYLREGNYIQAVKQLEIAAELYANVNDRTVRFYYLLVLAYAQSLPANCAKARAIAEEIALISADYGAGAVEAAASCPDASFLNP